MGEDFVKGNGSSGRDCGVALRVVEGTRRDSSAVHGGHFARNCDIFQQRFSRRLHDEDSRQYVANLSMHWILASGQSVDGGYSRFKHKHGTRKSDKWTQGEGMYEISFFKSSMARQTDPNLRSRRR
jgi:hypothetical protein